MEKIEPEQKNTQTEHIKKLSLLCQVKQSRESENFNLTYAWYQMISKGGVFINFERSAQLTLCTNFK
jgi:hypothetical protein